VAAAFLSHSGLMIALAASDPAGLPAAFPAGQAYWHASRDWIVTGRSPEYEPGWWLPAHCQLFAGMVVFTYTSLGVIPFWQGFHEVDLMNCYVGQLLVHSHDPWTA